MFNTKSSLITRSISSSNEEKKKKFKVDDHPQYPDIPEEIIVDGILTRLPIQVLSRFSCVSKSWNYTISHDPVFASSHFIQSQKKPSLYFNILNLADNYSGHKSLYDNYMFCLDDERKRNSSNACDYVRPMQLLSSSQNSSKLVGFCNGMRCIKMLGVVDKTRRGMHGAGEHQDRAAIFAVLNPSRKEFLSIPSAGIYPVIGYGFGFDLLSKEYKVVCLNLTASWGIVGSVFTLGTNSWRRTSTADTRVILPHGRPLYGSPVLIKAVSENCCGPAIWCSGESGDLFWRVTTCRNEAGNLINEEMLLSFNLHNEKFQLMRFPIITTTAEQEQQHQGADQLLEFKGSLCVAFFEKVSVSATDQHNHRHHCHQDISNSCCCCCKIHLCVLKDEVKQIWSTETFDVRINSGTHTTSTTSASTYSCPPAPCCGFSCTETKLPTRITSFSDRVLLYWFDGEYLQFYDVQAKHLKAVSFSRPGDQALSTVSRSYVDHPLVVSNYHLHGGQGENFLSLRTFVPEGEPTIFYSHNIFPQYMKRREEKSLAGYVFLGYTDCSDRRQIWHTKIWVDSTPKEIDSLNKKPNVFTAACDCKKCQYLRDLRLGALSMNSATALCRKMLRKSNRNLNAISNSYTGAEMVVARKETNGGSTTSCDKCEAIDNEFVSALRQIKLDFDRYVVHVSKMEQTSHEITRKISTIDKIITLFGPRSLCEISIEIITELHKVKASLLRYKIEISQMEKHISKESLIKIREFIGRTKSTSSSSSSRSSCGARLYCGLIKLDFLTELVTHERFMDRSLSSALETECARIFSRVEKILAVI